MILLMYPFVKFIYEVFHDSILFPTTLLLHNSAYTESRVMYALYITLLFPNLLYIFQAWEEILARPVGTLVKDKKMKAIASFQFQNTSGSFLNFFNNLFSNYEDKNIIIIFLT